MSNPKVYIILVNYGTPDDTVECLESILHNSHQLFEVVIVDVQNKNNSLFKINNWLDGKQDARFNLIEENNNKGFAYANNIGIKYALARKDSDFLWILNNDTSIEKDSLIRQIEFYYKKSKTRKIGFMAPKTMNLSKRSVIQNAGGIFNRWTKFPEWIGAGEIEKGQLDHKEIQVDHIQGASMFFHNSLLDQIGLMDESYFLYFEDTDWCIKALKNGFRNMVCTNSVIYHKQGTSTGVTYQDDSKNLQNKKYFYQNLLKFYKRHFKWFLPIAYFILFKQLAGRLYHEEWQEARVIWRVIYRNR